MEFISKILRNGIYSTQAAYCPPTYHRDAISSEKSKRVIVMLNIFSWSFRRNSLVSFFALKQHFITDETLLLTTTRCMSPMHI